MLEIMISLLICFFVIQTVCIPINTIILFSWYQRRNIVYCEERTRSHLWHALLYSLPGILVFFFILRCSEFPRYGMKYWFGEKMEKSKKWYTEYEHSKLYSKVKESQKFCPRRSSSAAGRCIDIW